MNNLGLAIALFFLGLAIAIALWTLLSVWLFRIGKRNQNARRVYNILALITGGIIFTILGIIIFVLPQPFSHKHNNFRSVQPIAYNDSIMWIFNENYRSRGQTVFLSVYNMDKDLTTNIDSINDEDGFFFHPKSLAWNGKVLAVLADGFQRKYLLASCGEKILHKERVNYSDAGISVDPKTGGFILGASSGPYHEDFTIQKYDRDFKETTSDTFHFDHQASRISNECREFKFIGNDWYANIENHTFKMKFSGDTCRLEIFTTGSDSLFVFEGSFLHQYAFGDMITAHGIQYVEYPHRDIRDLDEGSQPYYFISHDTLSRRMRHTYPVGDERETEQLEGALTLTTRHVGKGETAEYEITGANSSKNSYYVFDNGTEYEYVTNLIRHNRLEIYTEGFNKFAAFDLVKEERIDNASWKDRITERFSRSNADFFMWIFYPAIFLFPVLLVLIIISQQRKKSGKSALTLYPFSLGYFLFMGLPFLILMLWALKK